MNKLIFLMSVTAVLFWVVSCSPDQAGKKIITERIQYDVMVDSDGEELGWWVNNIEGSRRGPFIDWLLDAAYEGEYQAWDYFNNPLTEAQLKAVGVDTVFMTLLRETPPYDEYDTIVINKYNRQDITRVRFLEEWSFDNSGKVLEKRVLGVAPVLVRTFGDEEYNQVLFWIYFDEDYPSSLK